MDNEKTAFRKSFFWSSENLTITFPNVKPMKDIHKYV